MRGHGRSWEVSGRSKGGIGGHWGVVEGQWEAIAIGQQQWWVKFSGKKDRSWKKNMGDHERSMGGRWEVLWGQRGPWQRLYPSFFGPDIWVKSESNLIYLSKIWVKTRPKKRVFATYPVSRQKCVFGLVWFGHDYGLWSKVKVSIW